MKPIGRYCGQSVTSVLYPQPCGLAIKIDMLTLTAVIASLVLLPDMVLKARVEYNIIMYNVPTSLDVCSGGLNLTVHNSTLFDPKRLIKYV